MQEDQTLAPFAAVRSRHLVRKHCVAMIQVKLKRFIQHDAETGRAGNARSLVQLPLPETRTIPVVYLLICGKE